MESKDMALVPRVLTDNMARAVADLGGNGTWHQYWEVMIAAWEKESVAGHPVVPVDPQGQLGVFVSGGQAFIAHIPIDQVCEFEGCNNCKIAGEKFCGSHMPKKQGIAEVAAHCVQGECQSPIAPYSYGLCEDHSQIAKPDGLCCVKHCFLPRYKTESSSGYYCIKHRERWKPIPMATGDNLPPLIIPHLICEVVGCDNVRIDSEKYCASHMPQKSSLACEHPGCNFLRLEDSAFCYKHMAERHGMEERPPLVDEHGTCDHEGCANVRRFGEEFCPIHSQKSVAAPLGEIENDIKMLRCGKSKHHQRILFLECRDSDLVEREKQINLQLNMLAQRIQAVEGKPSFTNDVNIKTLDRLVQASVTDGSHIINLAVRIKEIEGQQLEDRIDRLENRLRDLERVAEHKAEMTQPASIDDPMWLVYEERSNGDTKCYRFTGRDAEAVARDVLDTMSKQAGRRCRVFVEPSYCRAIAVDPLLHIPSCK